MTKSFDELHTEIAHCVEALQHAMHDAQEQGCDLSPIRGCRCQRFASSARARLSGVGPGIWPTGTTRPEAIRAILASAWASGATRRTKMLRTMDPAEQAEFDACDLIIKEFRYRIRDLLLHRQMSTAARVAICQDRDDVLDLYIERLCPAHHLMLEKK